MAKFGARSRANLEGVHPKLAAIANFVVTQWDCEVQDGVRTIEEQRKNVARGVSQTMASKHLPQSDGKSHAIDIMPYPCDWTAIQRGLDAVKRIDGGMQVLEAYAFAFYFQGVADASGVKTRAGADWDSDKEFSDHSFIDLPHHEIIP